MRKFVLILILIITVPFVIAAQELDLAVPAEVAAFVEKNTKAIDLQKADLNGDGTEDCILVLEDLKASPDNDLAGNRILLILTRDAGGKLTLAKRNNTGLVYCRECGGVFGDPFASLDVGPKTFTVNMYGGSTWRWSNSYKFNYSRIDKTWQLVSAEESSFNALDPDKVKTHIYTPPRYFGKIDVAGFDPEALLEKIREKAAKK